LFHLFLYKKKKTPDWTDIKQNMLYEVHKNKEHTNIPRFGTVKPLTVYKYWYSGISLNCYNMF